MRRSWLDRGEFRGFVAEGRLRLPQHGPCTVDGEGEGSEGGVDRTRVGLRGCRWEAVEAVPCADDLRSRCEFAGLGAGAVTTRLEG